MTPPFVKQGNPQSELFTALANVLTQAQPSSTRVDAPYVAQMNAIRQQNEFERAKEQDYYNKVRALAELRAQGSTPSAMFQRANNFVGDFITGNTPQQMVENVALDAVPIGKLFAALAPLAKPAKKIAYEATGAELGNLFHGTTKNVVGDFIPSRQVGKIGNMPFEGTFNAVFLAKDPSYAKNYAMGNSGRIIDVALSPNARVLRLPDIISEEVISNNNPLARSPLSSLPIPTQKLPFQKDFDDFSFGKLNEARIANGKERFTRDEFASRVGGEFDPSSSEWGINGLAPKYLDEFIRNRGYDAIEFGREVVVLNPKTIVRK